jgi:hypothetical protein
MEKTISIEEVIDSPLFRENVESELQSLITAREKRPKPGIGLRYRRDIIDRMQEHGMIHTNFFMHNIKTILMKKSKLPKKYRDFIVYVCSVAFQNTMKAIQEPAQ